MTPDDLREIASELMTMANKMERVEVVKLEVVK